MLQRKRKRPAPKRFRPAAPKPTATMCWPLPEAPPKPKNDVPDSQPPPSVPVCKSTPWPGTGKMSGNLFEDRNWLLPPNYLDNGNENKTENEPKNAATGVTSPRSPIKEEEKEPKTNDQSPKKNGVGDQVAHFVNPRRRMRNKTKYNSNKMSPKPKLQKTQARRTKDSKLGHDKSQAAMGNRNGKVEFQIQP